MEYKLKVLVSLAFGFEEVFFVVYHFFRHLRTVVFLFVYSFFFELEHPSLVVDVLLRISLGSPVSFSSNF